MMLSYQGICIDSWARVADNCNIKCDVVADEAQFEFGDPSGGILNMIVVGDALDELAEVVTAAIETRRTQAEAHERDLAERAG